MKKQIMTELTQAEVKAALQTNDTHVFFFYTPLCGTCSLAEKMLMVVSELLPDINMAGCNINVMPDIVESLQIQSAPYLLIAKGEEVVKEVYAFRSVDYLYEIMKRHCSVS